MRTLTFVLCLFLLTGNLFAGDVHVIDGDTLQLGDARIRLFGIDAPEAGQRCNRLGGGTWPCGKVAIDYLEKLVAVEDVQCDERGIDDFGRILGVCRTRSTEINGAMIEGGLSWSFKRYSSRYNFLEDHIRAGGVGIWQAPTDPPWVYRSRRWDVAKQVSPNGCPIKGNISRKGEKIYHAPWSPWDERTRVNSAKGERWFCDEAEAIRAGWRAPRWGK
jgi:endonuclease YncB( thermonuclease family)